MKTAARLTLIIITLGVFFVALGQAPASTKRPNLKVVGTVVGYSQSEMIRNPISALPTHCYARLLFRVDRGGSAVRAGQYLVLQYDEPPMPCHLPSEMWSGQSVWEFTLDRKASGHGRLRKLMRLEENWTPRSKPKPFDTPYGELTLTRCGNLMMLGDRRVEDLPLNAVVREFKFGPADYKQVK